MTKVKFWTSIGDKDPFVGAESAARFEREGWDGVALFDSQCLFPDVWSYLTLCAQATKTVALRTGVTNPITRHPSVTAAAAASIQLVSKGRFVLGVGRGDSALAYIGAAPMVIGKFEPYMEMLQTYLRGEMVPLEDAGALVTDAVASFDKLAIGKAPAGSSLTWLKSFDLPKVPLEAMVTGPTAIEAAARVADIVTFGLAGEANRLRWGVETARNAATAAGRDPDSLQLGAYVPVIPHADINVAREMARGGVATMARFSIMNKTVVGPTQGNQQATLEKLAQVYDMNKHDVGGGGPQKEAVDAEFIDQFAIVGPPDRCIARLKELVDLGITTFTIGGSGSGGADMETSYRLLIEEVLPAVRG